MRGRILPVFVSPRQSRVILFSDNDLHNPHHELRLGLQFSTRHRSRPRHSSSHRARRMCQFPANKRGPCKYTRGLKLDLCRRSLQPRNWAVTGRELALTQPAGHQECTVALPRHTWRVRVRKTPRKSRRAARLEREGMRDLQGEKQRPAGSSPRRRAEYQCRH